MAEINKEVASQIDYRLIRRGNILMDYLSKKKQMTVEEVAKKDSDRNYRNNLKNIFNEDP